MFNLNIHVHHNMYMVGSKNLKNFSYHGLNMYKFKEEKKAIDGH